MLEKAVQDYLSRLLLTFSDLCDTDEEIAACLTFMQAPTPTGLKEWNASMVRAAIPTAYSIASSASDYSTNPNNQTLMICRAVYRTIKDKEQNETSKQAQP